jgi:signal transduction histidine kinase/CheY-like chemotaxis protein
MNSRHYSSASSIFLLNQTPLIQGMLVLYIWLVIASLCGIGSIGVVAPSESSIFILSSIALLSALAFALMFFEKYLVSITLVGYIALAILPSIIFNPIGEQRFIVVELFYIALIVVPVFFRIWQWRLQLFASVLAFVSIAHLLFRFTPQDAFVSIILIGMTAILSTLVVYVRQVEVIEQSREKILQEKNLDKLKAAQFQRRVWRAPMLQIGCLLILVFVESNSSILNLGSISRLNALIIVILGMLLLKIVRRHYLSHIIMGFTLCAILMTALSRPIEGSILYSVLPIVYLTLTTAGLPWFFEKQLFIAWIVSLLAFFTRTFPTFAGSEQPLIVFADLIKTYNTEMSLIILGASSSLVIARMVQQHYLTNSFQVQGTGTIDMSLGMNINQQDPIVLSHTPLESSVSESILYTRNQYLVKRLFIFGVFSSFVATLILISSSISYWYIALGFLLVFIGLWGVIYHFANKKGYKDWVWPLGGLLAIMLFLLPSILLVVSNQSDIFWVIMPIAVLIGIGTIPWVLSEAIPVFGVCFIIGVDILTQLGFSYHHISIFGICGLIGTLFSYQLQKKIKQGHILTDFQHALHRTTTATNSLRVLSDYLGCLFSADSVLLSSSKTHLEMLRRRKLYSLDPSVCSLIEYCKKHKDIEINDSGVALIPVNWLPIGLSFFDVSFGEFSAQHGLIIELKSPLGGTSKNQTTDRYIVFIPFRRPIVRLFWAEELRFASVLSSVTTLHLRTFEEQNYREQQKQAADVIQSEREYELSTLVHDINNTVQDLTLLCDGILEDLSIEDNNLNVLEEPEIVGRVRRIAIMARSMATVVSDAKRKRELERLQDLSPKEFVEVTSVIQEVIEFAKIRGERRRIKIQLVGELDSQVWVQVSAREHFETILRNLLNNATMYTDPGTTVQVVVRHDELWVSVDVTDNGPGLSPEECRMIFLSGIRGKSASHVPGGLGIGLSQSRRVAESAGGALEVSSKGAGTGATFTVKLPKMQAPLNERRNKESWALIVEDQPSLIEFYAKIAKALHLVPALASSTTEAEDLVLKNGRPTFVLTDLHLGQTDGLDLVKSLRKRFDDKLPILVVSGLNNDNIEQIVKEAGATDFIAKPVGKRTLFARIQSLLPSF